VDLHWPFHRFFPVANLLELTRENLLVHLLTRFPVEVQRTG
jgi:hypothetical protein